MSCACTVVPLLAVEPRYQLNLSIHHAVVALSSNEAHSCESLAHRLAGTLRLNTEATHLYYHRRLVNIWCGVATIFGGT